MGHSSNTNSIFVQTHNSKNAKDSMGVELSKPPPSGYSSDTKQNC